jgi:hypothetical protein
MSCWSACVIYQVRNADQRATHKLRRLAFSYAAYLLCRFYLQSLRLA